jgi:sulfate adenylyltransferase subunit 1 (EFTu-like GTPase family)
VRTRVRVRCGRYHATSLSAHSMQLGFAVGGRIEAGAVMIGDRLLLTPIGESATVKAIHVHEQVVCCVRT